MTDDAASDLPLWRQVLDDLEERLAAGDFRDRFPTDKELVAHYGVSRHTVREATQRLKARGVIERHRGRGSFVQEGVVAQKLGTLYSLFRAVEDTGKQQHSEVLSLGLAKDALAAKRFGLDPEVELVHLERLRLADGEPLALDTVWLPADVGESILDVDFEHTALYEELERHAGIVLQSGEETISAVAATKDLRDVLRLDDEEALLRIERHGYIGDRMVECRVTLVRGSRFTVVSTWPQQSPFPTVELTQGGRGRPAV